MFEFTNLTMFENRMLQLNVQVAFFTINYGINQCLVECAYSRSQKKFIFGFVNTNIGFTITLDGRRATTHLPANISTQLANCRDNTGNWNPSHFFTILNNQLPNIQFTQITATQYRQIYASSTTLFVNRIYFNHWRVSNISPQQARKTEELLGREILNFCRDNGIIPVFHAAPHARTLGVANDYITDYQRYGLRQNP